MRVITRQTMANGAAEAWAEQYRAWGSKKFDDIGAALKALTVRDPDEIDRIIGNGSWTSVPTCDECNASDLPLCVEVGQETARLCVECLTKAIKMVQETSIGQGIAAILPDHEANQKKETR